MHSVSVTRRHLLTGAAALAAAPLAAAAVAPPSRAQDRAKAPATPRAAGPIRIGCIVPLGGPQEVFGRAILAGARIAAEQVNAAGGVLGRAVEVVERDDGDDPGRAVAAVRDLAGRGVTLLCGVATSPVGLAASPAAQQAGAVLMSCLAAADALTHEAFNRHFFRVSDQAHMRNRAQARLMAERHPDVTQWAAIIPDTEYGRSAYAAFHDGLTESYARLAGRECTLAAPILARAGATDFRPQISALQAGPTEGLFIAVYGGDAMALYRQARFAHFFGKIRVLADAVNEFLVPMELGGNTPENLWLGMTWYYGAYKHLPMARALYEDNLRYTGEGQPMGVIQTGHAAVHAYAAAIRKCGGTETAAVISALEGLTFETAKGPVTFRPEDHQAVCDVGFARFKTNGGDDGVGMLDHSRSGYEVAEFVRYAGAEVIEPPSPGKPLVYGAKG